MIPGLIVGPLSPLGSGAEIGEGSDGQLLSSCLSAQA
jgi:hypothetical protein